MKKEIIVNELQGKRIDAYLAEKEEYSRTMVQRLIDEEKIAEEAGEVLIASKNDENLVYESVDLIFHTLLLLVHKGVELDEIYEEFARRRK